MSWPENHKHVGRIGALAVALGVGAAIASMPTVALADTSSSGNLSSRSSSAPGSSPGGSSADSTVSDSTVSDSTDENDGSTDENDGTSFSLDDSPSGSEGDAFSDPARDEAADIDADADTDTGADDVDTHEAGADADAEPDDVDIDEVDVDIDGVATDADDDDTDADTDDVDTDETDVDIPVDGAPDTSGSEGPYSAVSIPDVSGSEGPATDGGAAVAGLVPDGDSVAVFVPVEVAQVDDGPPAAATVMSLDAGVDADTSVAASPVATDTPPVMTAAAAAPELTGSTAQHLVEARENGRRLATAMLDMIDSAVRGFFNAAENRLLEHLPATPLRDFLAGALLLVRKTLFNQAPLVVPSSPTISELDDRINGRIGAFDLEGDTLTYRVLAPPEHGAVEVDADGSWTYTPGAAYGGDDSFTVMIDAQERWLNLSNLVRDGDRVVTIQVGEQSFYDTPDTAVALMDTSGRLSVTRNVFGQFTGSVTLSGVSPDTEWRWLDTSGKFGSVSAEDVEAFWPIFKAKSAENGAAVDLTLSYTDADSSPHAVLLKNVKLSKNADAEYVLTGRLARNEYLDPNGVDNWDVIGKLYKPMFDNFRTEFNLDVDTWKFRTVDVGFTGAEVYIDTLTPRSYERAGLYALDSEADPQAGSEVAPVSGTAADLTNLTADVNANAANAVIATSGVTAALSLGRSTAIGREDGSVELWTDGEMKLLHDSGWQAPVKHLLEYNQTLKDDQGNTIESTFTGSISGTTLTVTALGVGSTVKVGSEITGDGVAPGTTITKFVEQTTQCADEACTASIGTGSGGSNGYTGTYEVSISQTVRNSAQTADSTAPPGITFTQKNVAAVSPGFIAGLGFGSVQYWQPATGWVELRGQTGLSNAVTAMATFGENVVVGDRFGNVDMWSPPDTDSEASTWKNNWTQLHGREDEGHLNSRWPIHTSPTPPGAYAGYNGFERVTAIVEHVGSKTQDHGIVVAWGMDPDERKNDDGYLIDAGNVSFWDPMRKWTDLKDLGLKTTAMHTYGTGVAVGLKNGAVHYWDGTIAAQSGWTELHGTGWEQKVSAMRPYEQGLIVGLGGQGKSGAVQYYTGGADYKSGDWIELHGTGWASPVEKMISYRSESRGDGVLVGLGDGSVYMWNGPLKKPAGATDTLAAGHKLTLGDALYSNNGGYTLTLQTDGNLVLRSGEKELWASGTYGKGVVAAQLQDDGNFVLYTSSGVSVSGTGENGANIPTATSGESAILIVQDDGNAVLYDGAHHAQWATNTREDGLTSPEWRWWTELHGSSWGSGVAAVVPVALASDNGKGAVTFQDGVIVGLDNGAVEQWSGQGDVVTGYARTWTELAGIGEKNYAADALSRKEAFTCSNWQCSQQGALKDAVDFATEIARPVGGVALPKWQSPGGIGGAADPIFSNPKLQAASGVAGTYQTVAFYKLISPEAVNYIYPNYPLTFDGYIDTHNFQGGPEGGSTDKHKGYSVLYVKSGSVKAPSAGSKVPDQLTSTIEELRRAADGGTFKEGWVVENNPPLLSLGTVGILFNQRIQPGTTIKEFIGTTTSNGVTYDKYRLSGPQQSAGVNQDGVATDFSMKITTTPAIKAGLDVIPVAYGYTYVPDSFLPKFSSGNWSFGLLAAAGGGASVKINAGPNGSLWGPEENLAKTEWYEATAYGSFAVDAGVKLGADLTLNGLPKKPVVGAHAWVYGGMLSTFNTAGAPGDFQFGFNWYPDVSASDFKDLSGASATLTLTPYANLLYGLFLPKKLPVIGGWSFLKLSLGYENPLYATVCVDTKSLCPAAGGSGVANVYGTINDGTFNKNIAGAAVANAGLGNILTVTQNALFNPTKLAVDQLVTGENVAPGTKITKILGSTPNGDQYEVSGSPQAAIGGGRFGTHPKLTTYKAGSKASVAIGSEGLATFHVGALEAFTKSLSYDMKVPLYQFNTVLQLS